MSQNPITMRKLKEILRLKYHCQLSHRVIANSVGVSSSTVSNYANRAAQLGLSDWPLPPEWDDSRLDREFLQTRVITQPQKVLPNYSQLSNLLRHKENTLEFLWHQYAERHPANHYSYNHYCRLYRTWNKTQQPSMRMVHVAGEKMFVDYCGRTVEVIDPDSGEVRSAQVFVAVLGASNYTYAEATYSQQLEDWCMSHTRAFSFFGGVPEAVVPDNLKSGVTKACIYEPDLNPSYQQLANHYNVAVLPTRPRKPKDKAKAETGVQIVTRWIISVLKQKTFYSLAELNQRIKTLLVKLNEKPFKKLPGCRRSLFEQTDQQELKPLPRTPYRFVHIKYARVHCDYHIEADKHFYSVPYQLSRKEVEVHLSSHHATIYHRSKQVAQHHRSYKQGGYSTLPEHMPSNHRKYLEWSPGRFKNWAHQIGPATLHWVSHRLEVAKHPEQAYRSCMGLLSLSKKYSKQRLEKACERGAHTGASRLNNIKAMLKNGLEEQPLPGAQQQDLLNQVQHENIRGKDYYH